MFYEFLAAAFWVWNKNTIALFQLEHLHPIVRQKKKLKSRTNCPGTHHRALTIQSNHPPHKGTHSTHTDAQTRSLWHRNPSTPSTADLQTCRRRLHFPSVQPTRLFGSNFNVGRAFSIPNPTHFHIHLSKCASPCGSQSRIGVNPNPLAGLFLEAKKWRDR